MYGYYTHKRLDCEMKRNKAIIKPLHSSHTAFQTISQNMYIVYTIYYQTIMPTHFFFHQTNY